MTVPHEALANDAGRTRMTTVEDRRDATTATPAHPLAQEPAEQLGRARLRIGHGADLTIR